jgi:branched-chain amino acid transport system substrate-binding protein
VLRALVSLVFVLSLVIGINQAKAEVGITDTEILIGSSVNLSGASYQRAKGTIDGAKLFFDRINKAGGVNGRKIKLNLYDDRYDPKLTFENVQKLIEQDKVFALFGVFGAPTTNAIVPIVTRSKIPLFAPASGTDTIRNPVNEYIFNVRPSYAMEAEATVKFVVEKLKINDVGIFYQDDALGLAGREGLVQAMSPRNLKLKVFASYKRTSEKIDTSLDQVMKNKPAAVGVWAFIAQAASFIKLATERGYKPVYFGGTSLLTDAFTKALGSAAAENTIYVTLNYPLPSETGFKIIQDYLKDAKAAGIEPDSAHVEGYLNADVFVEGLKQAGKDLTRQGLIHALEKLSNYDAGGVKISFSATDHQGIKSPRVALFKNGHIEPVQQ